MRGSLHSRLLHFLSVWLTKINKLVSLSDAETTVDTALKDKKVAGVEITDSNTMNQIKIYPADCDQCHADQYMIQYIDWHDYRP